MKYFILIIEISCNQPNLPEDAVITHGKSYLYQDKLKVLCENSETHEIECLSSGKWSPQNFCA